MRVRRAVAMGSVAVIAAATLTSCQVVRVGAKCRTNELQHDGGAWILKCEKGRWRRALTKADAARILLSLQTTTTTAAPVTSPPTAAPTTAAPTTAAPTTTTPPRTDDLDPAFGNDGVASLTITIPGGTVGSLADVRATAAGLYVFFQASIPSSPGPASMAVARLAADGSLDPSFSGDGVLPLPGAASATADAAGRVYESLWVIGSGPTVRRYTTTGSLDPSLGGGGQWTLPTVAGCSSSYVMLAALGDGSVVTYSTTATCGLHRVAPDGSAGPWGDLALLAGANLGGVLAGPGGTLYVRTGSPASFPAPSDRILRLTGSGAADPTFGSSGAIDASAFTGVSYPSTMTVLADGSMLFLQSGGLSFDAAATTRVRRLLPSGSMDTTGQFSSGSLSVPGHMVTALPTGGFASSWWEASTQASHRAYTSAGAAGTSFGGGDRLRFNGGAWAISQSVVDGGRLHTVVSRGSGNIDVFKFAPTVA